MSDRDDPRLDELLGELRDHASAAPDGLSDRVLGAARWQHAARGSLHAATDLAGAAGVLLRMLLGGERRR